MTNVQVTKQVFDGNIWFEARQRQVKEDFSAGDSSAAIRWRNGNGIAHFFPLWLREKGLALDGGKEHATPTCLLAAQHLSSTWAWA